MQNQDFDSDQLMLGLVTYHDLGRPARSEGGQRVEQGVRPCGVEQIHGKDQRVVDLRPDQQREHPRLSHLEGQHGWRHVSKSGG